MSTATVERTVEGISLDHTVCHLFPQYGSATHSYCGVPRREQDKHHVLDPKDAPRCRGCGLTRCPTCARIHRANQ